MLRSPWRRHPTTASHVRGLATTRAIASFSLSGIPPLVRPDAERVKWSRDAPADHERSSTNGGGAPERGLHSRQPSNHSPDE